MGIHIEKKRILAIKNRAIGDTVLMTGALRLLRKHRPEYQIHVLVRSPAGELLENLPYIDRVISAIEPKDKIERMAYWSRLIKRLREKEYEMILNFHASFRTSLTAKFMRTKLCVANHHELNGRNWFSDVHVPGRGKVKPVIDRDLDLLRAIGIQAKVEDALPEIILSPLEQREASQLFSEKPASGSGTAVFIGIGASRETKRWPAEYFAEVARRLATEHDAHFTLATIDSDLKEVSRFWDEVNRIELTHPGFRARFRHFHGLRLRDTAKIVSKCQVYIGNDSGLKHVAAALGLRTFTAFGPEAPLEWHPYPTKIHPYAFIDDLKCRTETGKHWCSIDICQQYNHRCMREITPDQVWDDISRLAK